MNHIHGSMMELIEKCKNESNIDKRIEILYAINSILPKSLQLKIPSLITNDYIRQALYKIEEILLTQ